MIGEFVFLSFFFHIFSKVFFCFVLFCFVFATLSGMQDLSSPTKDQMWAACSGNRVLTTGLPGNS